MDERCERCGEDYRDVSFRDQYEVPENEDEGFYCERCLEELNRAWWEQEKLAYIYDNEGNRGDSPDYNPHNAWFEDGD